MALLNPTMWAELFIENRDYLVRELDCLLTNIAAYRDAIEQEDLETLTALLAEGRRIKELVDSQ